jgi:peptidoglycan-N-acetylglucosamine deacetylase
MKRRPCASVSLDLDNLWSYLRVRGDPEWERYPSYLAAVVPLVRQLLDGLACRITVFVVGRDADHDDDASHIATLAAHGHELANHSYSHASWLQRLPRAELEWEIVRAHEAIRRLGGGAPRGFRGPGFSWTPALFECLADLDYHYDASTFPTFLNPLARAFYFWKSNLGAEERKERRDLYGSFRDGFRRVRPYRWRLSKERSLLEIPVTTVPLLRTPFHPSYLLFLAQRSERLMFGYLRTALRSCQLTGVEPSFLLHPTDLFGPDLVPQLAFFPGMQLRTEAKVALLRRVLATLQERFELVGLGAHAQALLGRSPLPVQRSPYPRAARSGR